mmetsp:Transcript_359/g.322  ORF Transcript_359/g.322 Transcript_359/m.322 type:complete len:96 (-) Transcript_359:345-632(-)
MGGARKIYFFFKGKDQGWGNQKGKVAISVDKRDRDMKSRKIEGEFDYKGMKACWISPTLGHDMEEYDIKFDIDGDDGLIRAMEDEDDEFVVRMWT